MVSTKYYREQARLCFDLAAVAASDSERDRLLAMADRFTRLAEGGNAAPNWSTLPAHMIPGGNTDSSTDAN
jgi:hypothetical protein